MGEVFAGRYELVDPIGRGGVGAVWRAWDHRRRRYVAAKVLQQRDAHSLLRFVREQALRIDHPHVLAPASWAADDDKVLFTMDLVGGGSLVHLVGDYGPLPPAFVCTLLDQLLAGLAAVHAEGVVHRDIKPANILLEATGTARPRLRLSDFGISMRLGEPRLTETNYVVGTPGYFAPEQLLGTEPDFPADFFAVGLVALYLLEGAKPDAKALVEHFEAHGTPGAPKGVPEPLWQVVATLVQPDPQARFRTATGARKALASAVELLPEPGPDDELIEIFDQLGPLPTGFGPEGPDAAPPTSASGRARAQAEAQAQARIHGAGAPQSPTPPPPADGNALASPESHAGHAGLEGDGWQRAHTDAARPRTRTGATPPDPRAAVPPDAPTGAAAARHSTGPDAPGPAPRYGRTDGTPPRSVPGEGAGDPSGHGTGSAPGRPAAGRTPPPPASAPGSSPHSAISDTGMSDTGSFHLPPPPGEATTTPRHDRHPADQQVQQAQQAQASPQPHPRPHAQPQPEQPPTPPTSRLPAPPAHFASPSSPPPHPPSLPGAYPPARAPALPPRPRERTSPSPNPDESSSTASYTAQDVRVPSRGQPAARHRAGRARRRPGPPAKVAVPVLVLALVCLAVGFWALTRI
ncbi:serine/threonine-protein kinase [Streptomyces fructofermentans]|uniref:serine/threonine-protein kinase n=1 Tax=Streptomyces fructofermentans TaxID=152141 RepID=UPI0037A9BA99